MKKLIPIFFVMSILASCSAEKDMDKTRIYVVATVTTTDAQRYDQWFASEKPILKKFGATTVMDIRSSDQKERRIVIAFPSEKQLGKFVKSPEFQKILPLNKEIAKTDIFHGKLY